MLGLTFDGKTFTDQFLICDIRTEMPGWEQERRFYFDPPWNPGRQVLIHPCPNSTFRIDWQVPPEYDLASEEASGALDTADPQIIGDTDYEIVWKSVYRFHARQVDRMRVGRVLVAGDAAHLVSPFGARGLNSGVPDAENAAWKIAFVLHGWADESLLDSYHQERHAAAVENLAVTSATMDFLVPQSEQDWARRRAILEAAATDPEARAQVDSGRLAEPFWYVDSPLTTPSEAHPFEGRPKKGHDPVPAPGVLAPDVEVDLPGGGKTRIRSLGRRGVLVLAGGGLDAQELAASLGAPALPRPRAVPGRGRPWWGGRRRSGRQARRSVGAAPGRPHRGSCHRPGAAVSGGPPGHRRLTPAPLWAVSPPSSGHLLSLCGPIQHRVTSRRRDRRLTRW